MHDIAQTYFLFTEKFFGEPKMAILQHCSKNPHLEALLLRVSSLFRSFWCILYTNIANSNMIGWLKAISRNQGAQALISLPGNKFVLKYLSKL